MLSLALTTSFAQSPVAVAVESFIVSEITQDDGTTAERLTPATRARPGQTIEYRFTAVNEGDTTLPPGNVVVVGPVPTGLRYIEGSATPSSERVATEFSADDGLNYQEPPVTVAGEAVPPEAYDAVRWTMLEPFEPGEVVTFVYRLVLE
ncbi:MAG: hypothetical protein U5L04_07800 [Trueperaceae bacterium]|nr:hypothetical protein [Trueperaceae bacterium]